MDEAASQNEKFVINLKGSMDEKTELPDVPRGCQEVLLNFLEAKYMSSLGISRLLLWIEKHKNIPQISVENCSVSVVEAFNLVEGLFPKQGVLLSFEIPFRCTECDEIKNIWLKRNVHFFPGTPVRLKFPEIEKCSGCNSGKMELDIVKNLYFSFLKKST